MSMNIDDINQPRFHKRQSVQATATISTITHAKKKADKDSERRSMYIPSTMGLR